MEARHPVRAGLIVVIVLLLAVLSILLLNLVPLMVNADGVSAVPQKVNRGVTSQASLSDAAGRADERARAWSEDAYLVRAEAAWYITADWPSVESPPVPWAFSYYAPSTRSIASVVIVDDTLLWAPPTEIPLAPRRVSTFPPMQGVEVAWLTFRAAGGETFLATHSEAQVTFRLQQKETGPVWLVSAFQDGHFAMVTVDAHTGVLVETQE